MWVCAWDYVFLPVETDEIIDLTNKNHFISLLAFLVLLIWPSVAFSSRNQGGDNNDFLNYALVDSLLPDGLKRHELGKRIEQEKRDKEKKLSKLDSLLNASDSLGLDSLKIDSLGLDSLKMDSTKSKAGLDAPVEYTANDSIVFEKGGYAHLFGQGNVAYDKVKLEAEVISINVDSSSVYAHGVTDSLGVATGIPVFTDGDTPYETKAIRYNFKSERGIISNINTQQGEGYVTGHNAKKAADNTIYMVDGKYTTCDNHEHPHFYLQMSRAKVKPKKNAVSGPAHLVVADVPLPIWVPFFYFPFTTSYTSGFIMPTYVDDSNRGFGLEGGGYYFAVSDLMDLKLTTNIFTMGSWAMSGDLNYNKRYRYSGSFRADYQVTKTGDKGLPDFRASKDFKIMWSHRQDAKANPNSSFSASVNFSTSSYEKTNYNNQYNPAVSSQSTKTSSVSYSRSFPDQKLTLSSTFNIAQSMRDSTLALTLPDLNISLGRRYPFKRKNAAGEDKWYEKISLSYTGRLTNSITSKEDQLHNKSLAKDWKNGMSHSIPVSASFTLFKYLNVTPTLNYKERWYTRKIERSWNKESHKEVQDTISQFNRVYNYNMSVSANTKMYGMYKPLFMQKKELQIRHVFSPSITVSAAPDFGATKYGYWKSYNYVNPEGETITKEYSPYSSEAFGVPGKGRSGVISFDMSNNIEMKYKSDKDSTGFKKVSLIDELGASMSYNTAAEVRPWSDLSTRLRLKLSKSYTFTMNASFATYAYEFNEAGNVVVGDRTEWSYGRFGRFQGYGSSFSYTFNNDTWNKWFGDKEEADEKDKDKNKQEEDDQLMNKKRPTKEKKNASIDADGYEKFSMPWSLNINYSFNIREDRSKAINKKSMRYPYKYTHNMNCSGSVKLSNKWNVSFSSGYDFEAHKVTQTSMNLTRNLHCWELTASVNPFGYYRSYTFTIRASSQILQDLKWDQRSSRQSNIEWY